MQSSQHALTEEQMLDVMDMAGCQRSYTYAPEMLGHVLNLRCGGKLFTQRVPLECTPEKVTPFIFELFLRMQSNEH